VLGARRSIMTLFGAIYAFARFFYYMLPVVSEDDHRSSYCFAGAFDSVKPFIDGKQPAEISTQRSVVGGQGAVLVRSRLPRAGKRL
jgi:hypothetical protein